MSEPISTAGRVCLCEWSGPVSVTMVVSLLSTLKHLNDKHEGGSILILHLKPSSAKSIMKSVSSFVDVLPAVWTYCHEVILVCHDDDGALGQLRRALCGSQTMSLNRAASHKLGFFSLLDDAFTHVQTALPHDVLELRRRRIRSGTWSTVTTEPRATQNNRRGSVS